LLRSQVQKVSPFALLPVATLQKTVPREQMIAQAQDLVHRLKLYMGVTDSGITW